MLCPPSLASDWVEDGEVTDDEAMLRAPAPADAMPQLIQAAEVEAEPLNTEWADFAPGYIPCVSEQTFGPVEAKNAGTMSLLAMLADTEKTLRLPVYGEDVAPEFRMDMLEKLCGKAPGNGSIRERLNTLRRERGLKPFERWSLPDAVINALGRGVMGGAKAGGKAVAQGIGATAAGAGALVSGTGELLSTPGVPELLIAGALLGVGIPLIVHLSKKNGGIGYGGGPDIVWVDGYFRSDGTYVPGHFRTVANGTVWDNWSTRGNSNPFTGKPGYKRFSF